MIRDAFGLLISVVDAKTIHSVVWFIARVLAIGTSVVLFVVLGYLLQRERAKE